MIFTFKSMSTGNNAAPSLLTPIAILVLLSFLRSPIVEATRHSWTTKHDARHLIGPIGSPFGFLTGGVYNLTVYDFELTVGRSNKNKKHEGDPGAHDDVRKGIEALQHVEAGFLLKRFDSEGDFSKFYETVMEKPSLCAFESHRSKDFVSIDHANRDDDLLGVDDTFEITFDDENQKENTEKAVGIDGVYLSMNQPEQSWKPKSPSITHKFSTPQDEGLYFLLFQLCPRQGENQFGLEIRSSFELDLVLKNYDSFGNASYLTAGEMPLPGMYLYFTISYALCFLLWAANIRNIRQGKEPIWVSKDAGPSSRPMVHAIHHLMTILLGLKTVTVFFEAARYHYIRMNGHAEFWSAIYFTMSFIKGIFMFTVILLIGSGWSLVKPFLNDREKKIIWVVLVLQVIDNVAVVVLTQEKEGERLYDDWSAVLHFVDILCCCAVLVPIVWQVNSLEKSVEAEHNYSTEEEKSSAVTNVESEAPATVEAARTLRKLKQFRSFYLLVVVYIYFTRIAVYLFATFLGFRQTWLRYFVTELGTLAFYAVIGFLFRPMDDNPYLNVEKQDVDLHSVEIEFETR
ncbi:hypothetical protein ACHAXS_013799 [Conticribra weissflogii]